MNFTTSKSVWETDPSKCHVSHVVLDSEWEAELARCWRRTRGCCPMSRTRGSASRCPTTRRRRAAPLSANFLVSPETTAGPTRSPLVLETKGYRGTDAQLKAETMVVSWVPGVNALGTHGRFAFHEFRDVFAIEEGFGKLADGLAGAEAAA